MVDVDFSSIAVGFDGSPQSMLALEMARHEASLRYGAHVVAIGVAEDVLGVGRDDAKDEQRMDALRAYLEGLLADDSIELEVRMGKTSAILADVASPAAVLIVGKRGSGGFRDLVLGSTALNLLGRAEGPVMVLPAHDSLVLDGPIVVSIDGTAASHRALDWAVTEAHARGTSVAALAVWRKPHFWEPMLGAESFYEAEAGKILKEAVASVDPGDVEILSSLIEGHRIEVLLDASQDAGLVVIGNEKQEGGRIQGHSAVISTVEHSSCPVVVIP